MMFTIIKIFFWAAWLFIILAATGFRICFALLGLVIRLIRKAMGRDSGYEVKFYG